MHVQVSYPDSDAEAAILHLARDEAQTQNTSSVTKPLSQAALLAARQKVLNIHSAESIDRYLVQLTQTTRQAKNRDPLLGQWLEYGVSPRGTIALDRCAKAHAWLKGKDFVSPDDIHAVIHDVFRHRLLLSFEAEAEGISSDQVIDRLLETVAIV